MMLNGNGIIANASPLISNGKIMASSKPFPSSSIMGGPMITQNLDMKMPAYMDRLLIHGRGFSPFPSENTVYFRSPLEGTTAPTPGCYSVIEASTDRLEILFDLTRLDALHGYIGPLLATVVVGNQTSNEAQVADVVASGPMEWTHIDLEMNLEPRKSHSMANLGRLLYLFGGTGLDDWDRHTGNNNGVDKLFGDLIVLDCESLTWQVLNPAGEKPTPRCLHSADFLNGKMYIFGGAGHAGNDDTLHAQFDDLFVYDPDAGPDGTWSKIPKRGPYWPEKRDSHSTFVLNGKLYIIGGNVIGTDQSPPHLATNFYVFDPVTQLFTMLAEGDAPTDALPLSRFPSVNVLHKAVWMFGGFPSEKDTCGDRINNLYKYTEGAKAWKMIDKSYGTPTYRTDEKGVPVGRDSHSSCVMHDKIILSGGWQVHEAFEDTYEFDPMLMKWTALADAPCRRVAAAGAPVSNFFYVQGGFHKEQGNFNPTGSLHQTVNNNCKVLFHIHKLGYPHVARGLAPPEVIDSGIHWEEVVWPAPLDSNANCNDPNPKPLEYELYYKERDTPDELKLAYKGTERRHRQEGLKPLTWYTWIWRVNNGVGMSGMSPEGDGPTKDRPPLPEVIPPMPIPQFTNVRKPVQDMVTEYIPKKVMVEQIVMVPVKQMVEQIIQEPFNKPTTRFEVESIDAKALEPGRPVTLYNLKNNAEMNGQAGVLEVYDQEKGAWTVILGNGQGAVTVKPENLIIEQMSPVQLPSQSMIPPFPLTSTVVMPAPQMVRTSTPPPMREAPPPTASLAPATPRVLATPTRSIGGSYRCTTPTMVRADAYPSPMTTKLGQPVPLADIFTPRTNGISK